MWHQVSAVLRPKSVSEFVRRSSGLEFQHGVDIAAETAPFRTCTSIRTTMQLPTLVQRGTAGMHLRRTSAIV